jgi:hypothetical protein
MTAAGKRGCRYPRVSPMSIRDYSDCRHLCSPLRFRLTETIMKRSWFASRQRMQSAMRDQAQLRMLNSVLVALRIAPAGIAAHNGTPARFRLVRMVCNVCTRLTVGNPVSRWVN